MSDKDYTVLLVDPDARTRELLAEHLSSTGCTVLHAADGDSALRVLQHSGARLVLTLLKEMARRGVALGLATLCIGGGQGGAMVLELL